MFDLKKMFDVKNILDVKFVLTSKNYLRICFSYSIFIFNMDLLPPRSDQKPLLFPSQIDLRERFGTSSQAQVAQFL